MPEKKNLEELALQVCQVSSEVLERFARDGQRKEANDRSVASIIPETVDMLIKAGMLNQTERQAASELLTDHKEAIRLLKEAANLSITQNGINASSMTVVNADGSTFNKIANAFSGVSRRQSEFEAARDAQFRRDLYGDG